MRFLLTTALLTTLLLTRGAVSSLYAQEAEPAITAAVPGSTASTNARPWPHELSDIAPDPKAVWGKLDNGLRYVIVPTGSAPARGSLRMLVLAGSGVERDDQQGIAHFLEHMAFNGTKHYPAGEMVEYFQRLGMSFVTHTNAATDISHTVYKLELPRANEELSREGLTFFRDLLDGMLLAEEEIEKERGIILNEQIAGNTASYRAMSGNLQAALVGTRLADRMPIGKAEVISRLTREQFVEFHETWYTPGRTVIVASGDFEVAMLERLIRAHFDDAQARRGEQPDQELGQVASRGKMTARFNAVSDASAVTVSLTRVRPVTQLVDNKARSRDEIMELLINRMVSNRIDKLTEAKDAVIQAGNLSSERAYNVTDRNFLAVQCQPKNWTAAVNVVEQEIRRAVQHGFTSSEFELTKTELVGLFQAVVDQADTRQPDRLADQMVKTLVEYGVFAHPNEWQKLLAEQLPGITKDECNATFKTIWDTKDLELSVTGNLDLKGDASKQILAAHYLSTWKSVTAPVEESASSFAFTDFGPAGQIVSRSEQADLGIVQAAFANNVRVNIKQTPFEKNNVRTLIRVGGGLLELPADKPGLQHMASATLIAGGLKGLTLEELNRQLAGKSLSVMFAVGDDAFQLGGPTSTAALELQLQVCTAYLTAPGFAPQVGQQFIGQIDQFHAERKQTAEGVAHFDGNAFLRSQDPRFVLPPPEAMRKLTLDDVQAWLAQPFREGFLEVTLVGDIDPDKALEMLSKTLGALPSRAAEKPSFSAARQLKFPVGEKSKELHFESAAPRALSATYWPVPGVQDISVNRRLNILKAVLFERMRLKIREELGATYTPNAILCAEDAYPEYGYLAVQLVVAPEKLAEMGPLVSNIAAELAEGTISDDEFARVTKPIIGDMEAQARDNGYWVRTIGDCQERPAALENLRSRTAEYSSITKADIEAMAKLYLPVSKATIISVSPKAGE